MAQSHPSAIPSPLAREHNNVPHLQEFLHCDRAVNFIAVVSFTGKITARFFFMHLLVAVVGPGSQ